MTKNKSMNFLLQNLGCFISAAGIYSFAVAAEVPVTGIAGICAILYRLFGIPMGLSNVLINIPIQVSHGTADDGHRYDSLYAHMSSITVAEGTAVQKGDLLGYVGNTGNVYGAGGGYHLHLELRVDGARVNPLGYVPSR